MPNPGSSTAVLQAAGAGSAVEGQAAGIYLQPGQLVACAEGRRVTTILGSCVAVCLFDERRGVGGVNHYLLPHWAGGDAAAASAGRSAWRFGNVAIERLLDEVARLGAVSPSAKLFGGACVLEAFAARGDGHLGAQNVRVAVEALAARGVPVVAQDVGGRRGRKLIFDTASGDAWVKEL